MPATNHRLTATDLLVHGTFVVRRAHDEPGPAARHRRPPAPPHEARRPRGHQAPHATESRSTGR